MSKEKKKNVPDKYSLHRAIASGQLEEAARLINSGDVDLINLRQGKNTPLHLSLIKGHFDLTRQLFDQPNIQLPVDLLQYAVTKNVPTDIVAKLCTKNDQVRAFNRSSTLTEALWLLSKGLTVERGSKWLSFRGSTAEEKFKRINNIKLVVHQGGADIYNTAFQDRDGRLWERKGDLLKSKRVIALELVKDVNNQDLTNVFEVARQKIADSIALIKYVDKYEHLPNDFNDKKLNELQFLVERETLVGAMQIELWQTKPSRMGGGHATAADRKNDIFMAELGGYYAYLASMGNNGLVFANNAMRYIKQEREPAENKISSINNLIKTLMLNQSIDVDAQNLPAQAKALGQGVLSPAGPSGASNSLPSSSRTKSPERKGYCGIM